MKNAKDNHLANRFRNFGILNYESMKCSTIINLLSEPLDNPTQQLLECGLNFSNSPIKLPIDEIISNVEVAIKILEKSKVEEVR